MSRTIYALLVGIDEYQPPVSPLKGCVNDINAMETFLRVRGSGDQLELVVLKNAQATRQAIIDHFRSHLGRAGADDVALFCYSGHGSQQKSPPEFWHLESDRMDETLVCYDSRTKDIYDLADKELAFLIAEVAQNNPHIVILLDCCHSGSGTRDEPGTHVAIRRAVTDGRERPLESYICTQEEVQRLHTSDKQSRTESGWFDLPYGNHLLIAACRDYETAKELDFGGEQRGAFSYYLLDTLQQVSRHLTYRDLFKRVEVLVKNNVRDQLPQIEVSSGGDLSQPFLGGIVDTQRNDFTLLYDNAYGGWTIDGGAVHGISPVTGDDTTVLAVFPITTTPDQMQFLDIALGTARVTRVHPGVSNVEVTLEQDKQPDPQHTYKAVIVATPMPSMEVVLTGDAEGIQLVRDALAMTDANQKPSIYVREVEQVARDVGLRVLAHANTYRITRTTSDVPIVADLSGYSVEHAKKVVQRLEHIARWYTILNLSNPSSRLSHDAVQMEVHLGTGENPMRGGPMYEETIPCESPCRLEYQRKDGTLKPPAYKLKLINTTTETLYCAIAYLSQEFGINTTPWFQGEQKYLKPGDEAWACQGRAIPSEVPDELWRQGITEYEDVYKLIVSTEPFDATLLEQDKLDIPLSSTPLRGGRQNTLTRLLHQARTRDPNFALQRDMYADWTTSQVGITIVRPLDAHPIPQTGEPVEIGPSVTVAPHPALEAQARLISVPQATTRDTSTPTLPPALLDHYQIVAPFEFVTCRGSDPGLSGLELFNVADYTAVTPQQPLVLNMARPASRDTRDAGSADDEHILPIGYDGKYYLPLGYARRTDDGMQMVLERLPAPLPLPTTGDRSITGSIRIFFQKVVHRSTLKLVPYDYPLLAVADSDEAGNIAYTTEWSEVRARVAAASTISLYIHGIFGDTAAMLAGPRPYQQESDLVLTFDYENINTRIQDTAYALKDQLEKVGLGKGHGKHLCIIAHSLGGLIARSFIECDGGNEVVQHLVMLGTPNNGTPWATLHDWATLALTVVLNGVAFGWPVIGLPARALSGLVAAIEKVDVTLDQMRPGSDFLNDLGRCNDPNVQYTVVAGNTSLLTQYSESQHHLVTLMERLFSQNPLHTLTAAAFLGKPNDMFASVESMSFIPANRTPPPTVREVACDCGGYWGRRYQ